MSNKAENEVPDSDRLPRKDEIIIAALIAHKTTKEAAASCGISETTLWRKLQKPDFQEKYRAAQRGVLDASLATLQGATALAVNTLVKNLDSANAAAATQAAKIILEFNMKSVEYFEAQQRIKALEEKMKLRGAGK